MFLIYCNSEIWKLYFHNVTPLCNIHAHILLENIIMLTLVYTLTVTVVLCFCCLLGLLLQILQLLIATRRRNTSIWRRTGNLLRKPKFTTSL